MRGMMSMDAQWNSISAQLHGSFLDRQIRRTNRNLLLVNLLLILTVVGYGWTERRYLYNFFAGPLQVDIQRLEDVKRPDDQLRYFIKVKGEDSSETGVQEIEQETQGGSVQRETVKAKYSILTLGSRLLIVKSNIAEKGPEFQGELGGLPPDVRSNIVAPLLKEYPNANHVFLPLMLDATDFRTEGYVALAICVPVLLIAAWITRKVHRRRIDITQHPIFRSISKYGALADVAQEFEVELRGNSVKLGRATVTQSWVFLPSTFGLAMCRIPDLIWAYKKVTRHYHNFIPTGKTYDVVMYDRYGVPLQMQARQKKIDAMMTLLLERAHWAVFGYSDDLSNALRTNWGGLVAAVDERRSGGISVEHLPTK